MSGALPWKEIVHKASGDPELRYRVHHEREYEPTGELSAKGGRTIVVLGYPRKTQDVTTFEEVAWGEARTHPNDNYNRAVGRDIAIRRALVQYRGRR